MTRVKGKKAQICFRYVFTCKLRKWLEVFFTWNWFIEWLEFSAVEQADYRKESWRVGIPFWGDISYGWEVHGIKIIIENTYLTFISRSFFSLPNRKIVKLFLAWVSSRGKGGRCEKNFGVVKFCHLAWVFRLGKFHRLPLNLDYFLDLKIISQLAANADRFVIYCFNHTSIYLISCVRLPLFESSFLDFRSPNGLIKTYVPAFVLRSFKYYRCFIASCLSRSWLHEHYQRLNWPIFR